VAISVISGGSLSNAVVNGGAVTLTFPSGVQQGDVVYVCSGIDGTPTVATSGYTAIANVTSTAQQVWVWRKIMGVTPDTSVTINGTGQPQDAHAVVALILRDVELSQPEDATPTTATGSSTNPNNPAITTTFNKAWVLAFASSRVNDATITAPSGYINQTSANISDTNPSTTAVATNEVTIAGVEDPPSWTDWATGNWGAITVAVRPGGFISVPVTGVTGTGQVGTVAVRESVKVPVTGVTGSGQTGSVGIALPRSVLVTGELATGEVGNLSATGKASVELFNVLGITALGSESLRIFSNLFVDGVESSVEVGSVDIRTGLAVNVDGVFCAMQQGEVAVWIGVNDGQDIVWAPVNDTQTPNWTEIPV
jgi:hypothetical protein